MHEEMLAEELMRVIDRCDIVVDFQSSNYHDIVFINQFIASSDTSLLSSAIPIVNVILGLNKLHGNIKDSSIIDYAYNKSAVAVSVNCGNNKNPNSVEVAYKSMLSVLQACYLAVFSDNIYSHYIEEESPIKKYIKVDSLVRKAKGGRFVKDWSHGEVLLSKQEIAKDAAGVIYKTDIECVICLPSDKVEDGGEWYYLGSYLKSLGEIIAGKNLKRSYFMNNINRLSDNTLEKHLQN